MTDVHSVNGLQVALHIDMYQSVQQTAAIAKGRLKDSSGEPRRRGVGGGGGRRGGIVEDWKEGKRRVCCVAGAVRYQSALGHWEDQATCLELNTLTPTQQSRVGAGFLQSVCSLPSRFFNDRRSALSYRVHLR